MSEDLYYDIRKDLEKYSDAWCYVLIGGRDIGKTYSTLRKYVEDHEQTMFVKRTNEDVDLLAAGNQLGKTKTAYEIDLSPYKAINRDIGTNIKAYKIKEGIGGFYETDDEGSAVGKPVSYLISLNSVSKVKGFDTSECEAIIFDEFIPQPWERWNRKEGEQLMDLYETVERDRYIRTGKELKLILLANAVNIYNPVCEVLDITDTIAEMQTRNVETLYMEERGILIRRLTTPVAMLEKKRKTGIYRSMKNTAWGRMAFGNDFAYNDFSKIKKQALKGFSPVCSLAVKEKTWYVYRKEGVFYMCRARHGKNDLYDLNLETEQKRFFYDHVLEMQNASIDGRMTFETYGMYDLVMNYKKRYQI